MHLPPVNEIPSESTIEQLTNHHILNWLGVPEAWFFVPTKNDERVRGFDAAGMNMKMVVIQYKRVRTIGKYGALSLGIDVDQHQTLISNFPPGPHSYAFFCFSEFGSYGQVDHFHMTGAGAYSLARALFVDVHAVPLGTTTLRLQFTAPYSVRTVSSYQARKGTKHGITARNGFDLVHDLKECTVGVRARQAREVMQRRPEGAVANVRLSVLVVPIAG